MVVYEIDGEFRNYGDDFLRFLGNDNGEYGGLFYTQINTTTLFTIPDEADYIHVYDLNPRSLSFQTLDGGDSMIPVLLGNGPCLASSETPIPRLFVTGGYLNVSDGLERHSIFWIFDLIEYAWNKGNDMNYARYRHGCIVVDATLWVMGTVPQIETIDITNIDNGTWSIHPTLSIADDLYDIGVVFGPDPSNYSLELIQVVGGQIGGAHLADVSDTVYKFNSHSEEPYLDTLPFGMAALSMASMDNALYGFGGWDGTVQMSAWIKYELLSNQLSHS